MILGEAPKEAVRPGAQHWFKRSVPWDKNEVLSPWNQRLHFAYIWFEHFESPKSLNEIFVDLAS